MLGEKKDSSDDSTNAGANGESEGGKKELPVSMPSAMKAFYRRNNIKIFRFSRPFKKVTQKSNSEFRDLWIKNTFYMTKETFPTIKRFSRVINTTENEHPPLACAIMAIQDKVDELRETIDKVEITQVFKPALTMLLKGVADAAVGGGTQKYQEAFLNKEFQENATPEERQLIIKLKEALLEMVNLTQKGLEVNAKVCPENLLPLQQNIEGIFLIYKTETMKIVSEPMDEIQPPNSPKENLKKQDFLQKPELNGSILEEAQ